MKDLMEVTIPDLLKMLKVHKRLLEIESIIESIRVEIFDFFLESEKGDHYAERSFDGFQEK